MPVYTLTTAASSLSSDIKAALAGEICRIHSDINKVPSTYVNVVYHEVPADSLYTDGIPAAPVLVSGWVRDGHPPQETSRLALAIAAAVSEHACVSRSRVLVGFPEQSRAVRGGGWPAAARTRT